MTCNHDAEFTNSIKPSTKEISVLKIILTLLHPSNSGSSGNNFFYQFQHQFLQMTNISTRHAGATLAELFAKSRSVIRESPKRLKADSRNFFESSTR